MPTENTCTVHPQQTSPLKHAKSHYSLRASTPTQSRSRAGTPTPRPSTPTISSPLATAGGSGNGSNGITNGLATGTGNGAGMGSGGGVLLGEDRTFTFDHCLWSVNEEDERYAGQERLYDVLGEEFLQHSLEGYNCCIFACKSHYYPDFPWTCQFIHFYLCFSFIGLWVYYGFLGWILQLWNYGSGFWIVWVLGIGELTVDGQTGSGKTYSMVLCLRLSISSLHLPLPPEIPHHRQFNITYL